MYGKGKQHAQFFMNFLHHVSKICNKTMINKLMSSCVKSSNIS